MSEHQGVRGLVALREKAGLSQFELGVMLQPHVNPQTVSRWERGESLPTKKHLKHLTDCLGCELSDLFGGAVTDDACTITTEQVENAIDAGMYLLVAGQFGGRLTAEQANDLKRHILGRLKAGEGA